MRKLPDGVARANRAIHARTPGVLERRRQYKQRPDQIAKARARWAKRDVRRQQWACVIHKKYRLTPDQYAALLIDQCGKCAMCGTFMYESPRIDHDHASGEVRGLLCDVCNRALGFIERYGDLANAYLLGFKLNWLWRKGDGIEEAA